MSSTNRRVPLSSNQNVANSPLRPSAAANSNYVKQKRSMAQIQREEQYGQPPPAKKQMLDTNGSGTQRLLKSPSQQQPRVTKSHMVLQQKRNYNGSNYESKMTRERSGQQPQQQQQQHSQHHTESTATKITQKDVEGILNWQKHHRARFPKMVFFFDHVPEDVRRKLAKEITSLGAVSELVIPLFRLYYSFGLHVFYLARREILLYRDYPYRYHPITSPGRRKC